AALTPLHLRGPRNGPRTPPARGHPAATLVLPSGNGPRTPPARGHPGPPRRRGSLSPCVAGGELLEDPAPRDAASGQQDHGVNPQAPHLRHPARAPLAPQRRVHPPRGPLADLPADLRLPPLEKASHVRTWRRRPLPRLEPPLQHLQHRGTR